LGLALKRVFYTINDVARRRAADACLRAADNEEVVIRERTRSRGQEDTYHPMIRDIARQYPLADGEYLDEVEAKAYLAHSFSRARRIMEMPPLEQGSGRILTSLDGQGRCFIGIQTSKFTKSEASDFIEFLASFGAENGIVWSQPDVPA
jgi:hypothetical protein